MYRFVALSWDDTHRPKSAAAARLIARIAAASGDWQSVLDRPGLRVFQAKPPGSARRAYPLAKGAGVVLGKLFDRSASSKEPGFGDAESAKLLATQGRGLVERCWGHYVAFLADARGERRYVLRDPSGGLPCYTTRTYGVDLFFSDLEDCAALRLVQFSADWQHLAAFFLYGELNTRSTGIEAVTQLYAGECTALTKEGAVSRSFYWDPVEVCEAGTVEDPDEARALLGAGIRRSVDAWASSYTSIVQEISGGLDSSIVAARLGKAAVPPQVLGFHFYEESSQGDERAYARAAAKNAGVELVEAECRSAGASLEAQLDPSRMASPAVLGFLPPAERQRRRLVRERQAGAVFTGQGGDHLFQQTASKLIAAEYLSRHGFTPGLLRVAADTGRLTRSSVWSVLVSAIAHGLPWRRFDPYLDYEEAPSILSAEARLALDRDAYSHPWVLDAGRLPACKTQQVFNLVDCQTFYLRPCSYADLIHPLISQPVIERCLQIPGYVLAHGGQSRGLVREAFAAELPSEIVHRRSKGATTGYFNRLLIDNATYLRELLLDGALVNQGVLDRRRLEIELSESELLRGEYLRPLLDAVRAEAWLNAWSGERPLPLSGYA